MVKKMLAQVRLADLWSRDHEVCETCVHVYEYYLLHNIFYTRAFPQHELCEKNKTKQNIVTILWFIISLIWR